MALDLPSIKGNKRLYVIVGGVAAAYVGFRWYRNRSVAPPVDANVTGTSSVTDAAGGSYGPGNVQYGGADITGESETPTTNAQWTDAAVTRLVQQGWDGATVQAALGKYLTDQALTTNEETIVRAAIAVAGNPPQGSHAVVHIPTPAPSAVTTPKSAPGGFRNVFVDRTTAQTAWGSVATATGYEVMYLSAGNKTSRTATPSATFYGLKPGARFNYKVRAFNSAGSGPWSGTQYFVTKKK